VGCRRLHTNDIPRCQRLFGFSVVNDTHQAEFQIDFFTEPAQLGERTIGEQLDGDRQGWRIPAFAVNEE